MAYSDSQIELVCKAVADAFKGQVTSEHTNYIHHPEYATVANFARTPIITAMKANASAAEVGIAVYDALSGIAPLNLLQIASGAIHTTINSFTEEQPVVEGPSNNP